MKEKAPAAVPHAPGANELSRRDVWVATAVVICFLTPFVAFLGYFIGRFLAKWPRIVQDTDFLRLNAETGARWAAYAGIALAFGIPRWVAGNVVPRLPQRRRLLARILVTLLFGTFMLLWTSLRWRHYGTHSEGDEDNSVRVVDFVPTDSQRDTYALIFLQSYGIPAVLGAWIGGGRRRPRPVVSETEYDPFHVTPAATQRLVTAYEALRLTPGFVCGKGVYLPASALPADKATMRRALRYVYANCRNHDGETDAQFRNAYRDTAYFLEDRIAQAATLLNEKQPVVQELPEGDPVGSMDLHDLARQTQREAEHLEAEWRAYATSVTATERAAAATGGQ